MACREHEERIRGGVEAWNRWREDGPWIQPDLWGGYAENLELRGINLRGAKLTRAVITSNDFTGASFAGADLSSADLRGCILEGADFRDAVLSGANLSRTNLRHADVIGAQMEATVISDVDLSEVAGLELVRHWFRSEVSTSALELTAAALGRDPSALSRVEAFFRGAGLPDEYIGFFRARVGQSAGYYSCVISHSSHDQEFVDRLYADLQSRGIRCWLASEDLPIGGRIRPGIHESILRHDKLLLVLSANSAASHWVEDEVEHAFAKERARNEPVLFPLRVDDADMEIDSGWVASIRNTRQVGDFREWKDYDAYTRAFSRLLRNLRPAGA